MKRPLVNRRLTDDELLAAELLSIHDSDDTLQVGLRDVPGASISRDPLLTQIKSLENDLAAYTANRISAEPVENLPELGHEIACKRIRVEESWQTAFQNYKQELSRETIYLHEELGLQITAAFEKARTTTAVQEASGMSLSLRTLKESYWAAERHVDNELRVRLARGAARAHD